MNIKTINFLFNKFNNLYEVSKNINKNTFYSLLSSGFIKDIKNEDVLNAILIVYENLDYLNTEMTVTRLDFNQKSEVSTEIKNGAMDAQGMSLILNMTEDKIKENEEELNLAIAAVDKAIDSVEKELKHLGCKLEYEERKVLLENVEQKK